MKADPLGGWSIGGRGFVDDPTSYSESEAGHCELGRNMERCDPSLPLYTERAVLDVPSLESLRDALAAGLKEMYDYAEVTVEPCMDLRDWGIAFPGLSGSARLVDIGGVPNLLDPKFHGISYSIADICKCAGVPSGAVLGASAADAKHVGSNAELMPCEDLEGSVRTTYVAKLGEKGSCQMQKYDHGRVGFLGNLFISEGAPGEVLKVSVSGRRDGTSGDFTASLHKSLKSAFPGQNIGLGGAFRLQDGRFKAHIMPDFKKSVMVDGPEVNSWLRFFEFGKGATFLSTVLTGDPSGGKLNLRQNHTHFFNAEAGEGGHYHHDLTPCEAKYTAFFTPAASVYRIENAFDRSRCLVHPC